MTRLNAAFWRYWAGQQHYAMFTSVIMLLVLGIYYGPIYVFYPLAALVVGWDIDWTWRRFRREQEQAGKQRM